MSDRPYEAAPRTFTLSQRVLIWLATHVGYWLVYIVGRSLRWTVEGWEHWQSLDAAGVHTVMVVWHNRTFPAVWYFRRRRIVAMISQNVDGEYIARIVK